MNKFITGAMTVIGIELWLYSMCIVFGAGVDAERRHREMEEHYDVSYNPDRDGEC